MKLHTEGGERQHAFCLVNLMQVKHHFFFLTNSRVCIERPSDVVIGIMIAECM